MVLWEPRDDRAVSPVVGMVLVLGISIVGIAAIMYWGLPAIDEMKANVEHKSVESQFQELDATIKELVAGTTEKTAKRWQPTINRGQVYLVNESDGWVYATEMYHATKNYDFLYSGFHDTDNLLEIQNVAGIALDDTVVQAYRMNGTTSGHDLKVQRWDAVGTQWVNWDSTNMHDWGISETVEVRLMSGADPAKIGNATIRFRIFETASVKAAEAWYVPTGRIDYRLESGLGTKTVSENNGAVLTGNGQTHAMLNPPPIPPVKDTAGVPRSFARAVLLNATGSFAGEDRFNVLVTLYSTSTLASYDCTSSAEPYADCVETTKLFLFGEHRATWANYLTNAGRGYTYQKANAIDDATEVYLVDRPAAGRMGYTLLQSTVQIATQG